MICGLAALFGISGINVGNINIDPAEKSSFGYSYPNNLVIGVK